MQLKALLFASFVASAYGSTVQDILNDVTVLNNTWTTFGNAISAFPDSGGTLNEASAIQDDATALIEAYQAAVPDAANLETPVSVSDAETVLLAVSSLQANENSTLINIVAKKPAFDALGGGFSANILQDLQQLNATDIEWGTILVGDAPSELLTLAQQSLAAIEAAYAKAITAYQGS